jgi:hypothetical protein
LKTGLFVRSAHNRAKYKLSHRPSHKKQRKERMNDPTNTKKMLRANFSKPIDCQNFIFRVEKLA